MTIRMAAILGMACVFSNVTHPMEQGRSNRLIPRLVQNAERLNQRVGGMMSRYFGTRIYWPFIHILIAIGLPYLLEANTEEPAPNWAKRIILGCAHVGVQVMAEGQERIGRRAVAEEIFVAGMRELRRNER